MFLIDTCTFPASGDLEQFNPVDTSLDLPPDVCLWITGLISNVLTYPSRYAKYHLHNFLDSIHA